MNVVFFAIVAIAFVTAAVRHLAWVPATSDAVSPMAALTEGMIETAGGAVTLALGLVGVMALFLGLMKVAEAGGLLRVVARLLRPVMERLFPDVPAEHPAMGAIVMNMSANGLGLGNAATPFGIRAMQGLESLNPRPGSATNSMALFLAINTSSVTLLPTGVIALRAAAGSADPAGIVPTTLFATLCSTTVAIAAAKLGQRLWPADDANVGQPAVAVTAPEPEPSNEQQPADEPPAEAPPGYPAWVTVMVFAVLLGLIALIVTHGRTVAPWIIPGLAMALLTFGVVRRVRIYEAFVDGARDGFQVAIRIIPYLVAILVAVGMLRASGAMDLVITPLGELTGPFGLPAEALPMALLRPLSGSGAYGVLASIINDPAVGPDSYTGYLVSTIQGSTETTFYVLAVYCGAVGVRRLRHALLAALSADVAGVIGAVVICSVMYGS